MKILIAVLLLSLAVASSTRAESIQGRWKLIAAEDLRADGSVGQYPWGRHPVGWIVVERGWCLLQIMSTDVPSFSLTGEPEGEKPVGDQMKDALIKNYIGYEAPENKNVSAIILIEYSGQKRPGSKGGLYAPRKSLAREEPFKHYSDKVLPKIGARLIKNSICLLWLNRGMWNKAL